MTQGVFTMAQQLQGQVRKTWGGSMSTPYVEYLVVAGGGGGGGGYQGGGGGAGGLLQGIVPVTNGTSYTVTVGAAGTAGPSSTTPNGGNGQNSVFGNITAIGGGGGGAYGTGPQSTAGATGAAGGSGGGAGLISNSITQGIPGQGVFGQGNAGGTASGYSSPYAGGGGGGAGTVGSSGGGTAAANGGAGIASGINGTVTAYAGGGAGGTYSASGGTGGVGGGGAGSQGANGTNGSTNTGGGGGASGVTGYTGGSGGSGIVIISYPDIYKAPTGLTGTYTTSTSGSGSVQFNGSNSIKYGPNSAINLGSSNFTIEGWVYPTTSGGFLAQRQAGSASGWSIGGGTSGALIGGTWYPDFGSGTVYLNAWQHNAWVRSGTTMYFFINGVLDRTTTGVTGSVDVWAQPMNMGSSSSDGTEGRLTGYVSNARIVSGTALYTSTFTPSTVPLTAISGTLFLNNAVSGAPFVDTSTNYFTPTFAGSGSPVWNQSSPFATGLGYKNRVYTWTGSGTVTF